MMDVECKLLATEIAVNGEVPPRNPVNTETDKSQPFRPGHELRQLRDSAAQLRPYGLQTRRRQVAGQIARLGRGESALPGHFQADGQI